MKTHAILILLALGGSTLAQGPLTPPSGGNPAIGPVDALTPGGLPQATMKTLHQVEPRTAIPGGTSGVTISQSGSYYLTGNIQVATGHGIAIEADGVTLDLNGFTISTTETPALSFAVAIGYNQKNISVMNGNIQGSGSGVFQNGVGGYNGMGPPRNVRVTGVNISNCAVHGIVLDQARNNRVEDCAVDGAGIAATTVKTSCVTNGFINARIATECSLESTGTLGITAMVAENCYSTSAGNAINARCLVNSYGAGGGNFDVVSAGVAQNAWAEGGSGTGDGINATIVANSHGKRQNDGTGSGIASDSDGVVEGSLGIGRVGISGASVVADSTGLTNLETSSAGAGRGIAGSLNSVITGSVGIGASHPSVSVYGINGVLSQGSIGLSGSQQGVSTTLKFETN